MSHLSKYTSYDLGLTRIPDWILRIHETCDIKTRLRCPEVSFPAPRGQCMNLPALRAFPLSLRNSQILVVTHGAFLHFLTEDWDIDGNGGGNPLDSMCRISAVQWMSG